MSTLELKIPPVAVGLVFAALIVAASYGSVLPTAPFPGHLSIAIFCWLAGLAVALAGVLEFRRARTTVNPLSPEKASSVVTTGIYRLTRNPMYLGMAAVLLGMAAWWASIAGLLLVAGFCVYITRFQIQPEERALLASFGKDYADYLVRVRRWI